LRHVSKALATGFSMTELFELIYREICHWAMTVVVCYSNANHNMRDLGSQLNLGGKSFTLIKSYKIVVNNILT
jgi:hypothetical protein